MYKVTITDEFGDHRPISDNLTYEEAIIVQEAVARTVAYKTCTIQIKKE